MPRTDTAIHSAKPRNKTVKLFDGGLYLELASSYGKKVRSLFEKQIVPVFGAKHIAEVEPADILKTARHVEESGAVEWTQSYGLGVNAHRFARYGLWKR